MTPRERADKLVALLPDPPVFWYDFRDKIEAEIKDALKAKDDLLELAWGVIANAGEGEWSRESEQWQGAAHRWGVDAGFRMEHSDE